MATVKQQNFSIDDFRQLPEVRPALEFFGGRVIQKMSPKLPHSLIQTRLSARLLVHAETRQLGLPYVELRCTFGRSSHVFDIAYFTEERLPDPTSLLDRNEISTPPDLAIEILSPGQTVRELTRKLRSALRRGVRLGWLIDERQRQVLVLRPARKPQTLQVNQTLLGDEVVPGFALAINELFGWVSGRGI